MRIEELAYHQTRLGALLLRRRPEPLIGNKDVFEVKLGDEFLMSSLFTEGEAELANLGLNGLTGKLDVVIGGLGLGYTAAAALDHECVGSLLVIDAFEEVIGWHRGGLVPMGERLSIDRRCEMRKGDFFDLSAKSFDDTDPDRQFDVVLLDIDHSPRHFLDDKNGRFYTSAGLEELAGQLRPDAVFALWSNDPAETEFTALLESVFGDASSENIEFRNPYSGGVAINSVYVARKLGEE